MRGGWSREAFDRWAQKRWLLVVLIMTTYSAQSLLITASKGDGGSFEYDANSAVLLAEVLKLCFAVVMLPPDAWSKFRLSWSTAIFAVPAVLYIVQNTLVFTALRCLTPPEYQLLNNMKLFTTSFVFRVVMRRQLRLVQWLALMLLGLGMSVATQPSAIAASDGSLRASGLDLWQGLLIMIVVSWCSAFAGVLNEWLIKKSPSVLEANVWRYAFGSAASVVQMFYAPGAASRMPMLQGFSAVTWLVVLCNAMLGQTIAFLFRYADSIVKLYAVCAAMCFTTAISVVFFGFELRFLTVAGYAVCAISLVLYYVPIDALQATDSELLAAALGLSGRSDHCNGAHRE